MAEASSDQYLINTFKAFENSVIPLLRTTNTKYKKPAHSNIYAKVNLINQSKEETISTLYSKKCGLVSLKFQVIDDGGFY